MGLRTFHLLFISISVLLTAFIVAWATGQYRVDPMPAYLAYGLVSVFAGGTLVVYGAAFQRKTRKL